MLVILPIHAVPVAGPKQLQLKVCTEGVGEGVAGVGTAINDGAASTVTGAANCGGALGGGTGSKNWFAEGSCAQTVARPDGQHRAITNPAAIIAAAANFRILNDTLPLDSRVIISAAASLERAGAFGYNRAHDSLQVRPHFASVRGPEDAALLPAS